jgi:hypothetical protein
MEQMSDSMSMINKNNCRPSTTVKAGKITVQNGAGSDNVKGSNEN